MIGGAGMWMARAIAASRPVPAAPGGYPTPAPTATRPIQWLQGLVTLPAAFDPSRIGDSLAMKTEWSPMQGRGGNFRTHKLVEVDPDRMAFRATTGGLLFALAFLVLGVLVVFLMLKGVVSGLATGNLNLNGLAPLPIGLLFPAVGGYLLYSWTTPIVFDRRIGLFWKGWTEPVEGSDGTPPGNVASFKEIHALQLMPTSAIQHRAYELNLVMVDGERRHVVVYAGGSRKRLREDAAILAGFLGRPVWDAL